MAGAKLAHLLADDLDELHGFAHRLGIHRFSFQAPPRSSSPHYDITAFERRRALAYGAVACSRAQILSPSFAAPARGVPIMAAKRRRAHSGTPALRSPRVWISRKGHWRGRPRPCGLDIAARSEPLGIGQIGFVAQPVAAILPPSGWGPHRGSSEGFDNPSESGLRRPLNPFGTGLRTLSK